MIVTRPDKAVVSGQGCDLRRRSQKVNLEQVERKDTKHRPDSAGLPNTHSAAVPRRPDHFLRLSPECVGGCRGCAGSEPPIANYSADKISFIVILY
jgi:hypothetical protein